MGGPLRSPASSSGAPRSRIVACVAYGKISASIRLRTRRKGSVTTGSEHSGRNSGPVGIQKIAEQRHARAVVLDDQGSLTSCTLLTLWSFRAFGCVFVFRSVHGHSLWAFHVIAPPEPSLVSFVVAMRSTRHGALTTGRQSSAPISVNPAAFNDKSPHRDTPIAAALTQGLGASHMCRHPRHNYNLLK